MEKEITIVLNQLIKNTFTDKEYLQILNNEPFKDVIFDMLDLSKLIVEIEKYFPNSIGKFENNEKITYNNIIKIISNDNRTNNN